MNGILIVNKPLGCTSHDIVYKIKKITGEKVGHTGTLDPMAEGVLPILIGKGTLLSKYLINHDKKYIAEVQLGTKTDTADREGKTIETKDVPTEIWNKEKMEQTLNKFVGEQEQIPPMYSAIKIKGKKLYEYARMGKQIEIKPRKIKIYNINLLDFSQEKKQIKIEVYCGKGTYIRTLCENIAEGLGTVGYMKSLKRIQVGNFKIENSIELKKIDNSNTKIIEDNLISIEKVFEKYPKVELDNRKMQLFLNGVKLTKKNNNGVYKIYDKNKKFVGTGVIENNLLKRDIIL